MKNNQPQLEIYCNLRVKEREKEFCKKINLFLSKSLNKKKGAQYK